MIIDTPLRRQTLQVNFAGIYPKIRPKLIALALGKVPLVFSSPTDIVHCSWASFGIFLASAESSFVDLTIVTYTGSIPG